MAPKLVGEGLDLFRREPEGLCVEEDTRYVLLFCDNLHYQPVTTVVDGQEKGCFLKKDLPRCVSSAFF